MKGKDLAVAGVGLALGVGAFLFLRRKAHAAELPAASESEAAPTIVTETTAAATPTPPPGRETQSSIEAANQPYDGQAVIDAYLRSSQSSATRDLSKEQVLVTAQASIDSAIAKGGGSASAPVNILSRESGDLKKRREAYRGVVRSAAKLLQVSGVSGSGCGILDADRALSLDPFGMSVDRLASVVDTIEQKVSRTISATRKDATFRTICAMSDAGAICLALVTQINKAASDVERANAAGVASNSASSVLGRNLAKAVQAACQGAIAPSGSVSKSPIVFDAGGAATTKPSVTSSIPLKTGFL